MSNYCIVRGDSFDNELNEPPNKVHLPKNGVKRKGLWGQNEIEDPFDIVKLRRQVNNCSGVAFR